MKRDSTHKKRNVILAAVILAVVFCVTSIAMIPLIRLLSSEEGQAIILQKNKKLARVLLYKKV